MTTRKGLDQRRQERLFLELSRIRTGRVLVGGVGALGNEVVKNLAMMSVGRMLIVDIDSIELHNLPRSAFFFFGDVERAIEQGVPKARFVAEMVRRLNPDVRVDWFHGDIADLGSRIFANFDVAVSCFDAPLPRYVMNARCAEAGIPMVDAGLYAGVDLSCSGTVQVFHVAEGTRCYACSMAPSERARLDAAVRASTYGCGAIQARAAAAGGVSSSVVMASAIGALEAMETAKILGAREDQFRPRWGAFARFDFASLANPVVRTLTWKVDPDCPHHAHEARAAVELDLDSEIHTLHDVWEAAVEATGDPTIRLELPADFFPRATCSACATEHRWQNGNQRILGAQALARVEALPPGLRLPCGCERGLAFLNGEPRRVYGDPTLPRATASLRASRLPWAIGLPLHGADRFGEEEALAGRDLRRFGAA